MANLPLAALTVQGVANLLEGVGLVRYAAGFVEKSISDSDLVIANEDDLLEVGVALSIHRRRLLNQLAQFKEDGVPAWAIHEVGKRCLSNSSFATSTPSSAATATAIPAAEVRATTCSAPLSGHAKWNDGRRLGGFDASRAAVEGQDPELQGVWAVDARLSVLRTGAHSARAFYDELKRLNAVLDINKTRVPPDRPGTTANLRLSSSGGVRKTERPLTADVPSYDKRAFELLRMPHQQLAAEAARLERRARSAAAAASASQKRELALLARLSALENDVPLPLADTNVAADGDLNAELYQSGGSGKPAPTAAGPVHGTPASAVEALTKSDRALALLPRDSASNLALICADQLRAIIAALAAKRQTLVLVQQQMDQARRAVAARSVKERIDQRIEAMLTLQKDTEKDLVQLELRFEMERQRSIEHLVPAVIRTKLAYDTGFAQLMAEAGEWTVERIRQTAKGLGDIGKDADDSLSAELLERYGSPPKDSELYLVAMVHQARALLPAVFQVVEAIAARVNTMAEARLVDVKHGTLKGTVRCHAKAMEKYSQDYSRIKDIARCTMVVHPDASGSRLRGAQPPGAADRT